MRPKTTIVLLCTVLCLTALLSPECLRAQSIIDRLAYQTGIGAASRARANGISLKTSDSRFLSFRQAGGVERLSATRRLSPKIRMKKLKRIFTRIKLDRIKIKL